MLIGMVMSCPAVIDTAGELPMFNMMPVTVSANAFDAVDAAASVTVTVKVVVASVVPGVPLSCPVLVLKFIPGGSEPPESA